MTLVVTLYIHTYIHMYSMHFVNVLNRKTIKVSMGIAADYYILWVYV